MNKEMLERRIVFANDASLGGVSPDRREPQWTFDSLIRRFMESSKFNKYSPNTQASYKFDYTDFGQFLRANDPTSLDSVTPDVVAKYFKRLGEERSQATIKRRVASLRVLFSWVSDLDPNAAEFLRKIPSPKVDETKNELRPLSRDQVDKLYQAASGNTRDQAILAIALSTGANVSEILDMDSKDIENVDEQRVGVHVGQKNKRRTIVLPSYESDLVRKHLEQERGNAGPIFVNHPYDNRKSARLSRQGFWSRLKGYGSEIELPDLSPRMLRDTFVVNTTGGKPELTNRLGITNQHADKLFKRRERTSTSGKSGVIYERPPVA